MRKKIKVTLVALMSMAIGAIAAGCAGEATPYEVNNKDNYSVSVKFDANGGTFTTNTSIIVDSYNVGDMSTNSEGQAEIPLIAPDNEVRGNDAFTAVNNGYFFAGWYEERIENTDSEGNVTYTYANKWDFEKDVLKVDVDKDYSSKEPVMTLYAAWVPMFEIEFYTLDSGEYIDKLTFDPTTMDKISVPAWDDTTGQINMYDFPKKAGYTFNNVYYDAEGTLLVEGAEVSHTGSVDLETGTGKDNIMKLYIDWVEGEWYHIYTVEQFLDNASVSGCYEIHADLDFAEAIWPSSLMYGNFSGKINGNGHTFKNIEVTQTNNSKINVGLFGNLTDGSSIADVTFENVNFTIKSGTRMQGTSFGLLAGVIATEANVQGVKVLSSTLNIDSACYFGVDDYSIGLLCGMGDSNVVENPDIKCQAVGEKPETVSISVDGNKVTVEMLSE